MRELASVLRAMTALSVAVAAGAPAEAAPEALTLLICQPAGPELKAEQQHMLDGLYRYLEKKLGLHVGGVSGIYETDLERCREELKKQPAILMPSLPLYLELEKARELIPVAQPVINGATEDRYYLMARKGSAASLATLKGKAIAGTAVDGRDLLARVVFEGKLGAAPSIQLKHHRLALRAIRATVKGQAEAVLLDGIQYRALKGTRFEHKLEVVHVSEPVPYAPIAVVRARVPDQFAERLGRALAEMSGDADGRAMLNVFGVERFQPAKPDAWDRVRRALGSD